MKKIYIFFALLLLAYLFSCKHEVTETTIDGQLTEALRLASPNGDASFYRMPTGNDFTQLPNQDPKNKVNMARVILGKMLFYETGIALEPKQGVSKETYSCSSCHIPERGFTAGRIQGIADGGVGFGHSGEGRSKNLSYAGDEVDAQGARPLPVINLTYVTNALWAGNFGSFGTNVGTESVWSNDTLTEINYEGLEGLEANNFRALIVHRQVINKAVTDSLGLTFFFDMAYPEIPPSQRYTRKTAGFAIAAYFRSILTNEAPFQQWMRGNYEAMNEEQKRGALLFFGKAGCSRCHNSPSLNNMKYFALGVNNLYQTGGDQVFRTSATDKRNFGRGGFTTRPEDMFKFKVPQLYNLKDVGFYFHGASKRSLREVVEYFNNAVPENPDVPKTQISSFFHPLGMTQAEMDDLVEFLENGLFDPNMQRYVPAAIMSGNCFPDNDPQSQLDMGCK